MRPEIAVPIRLVTTDQKLNEYLWEVSHVNKDEYEYAFY